MKAGYFLTGVLSLVCACAAQPKPLPPVRSEVLSPEETQAMFAEAGGNWLYGHGLGGTIITVGTIALFPPYALYVVGNSLLLVSGEEPLRMADMLPEDGKSQWDEIYDTVASGPGRLAAAIAGREFKTREQASEALAPYLRAGSFMADNNVVERQ